jgi:hypothetical protein
MTNDQQVVRIADEIITRLPTCAAELAALPAVLPLPADHDRAGRLVDALLAGPISRVAAIPISTECQ